MTKEEKEILLQDLCGRLPYKICAKQYYSTFEDDFIIEGIIREQIYAAYNSKISMAYPVEKIKPYLRPMSSMTEDEVKDLLKVHIRTKYGDDSDYYKNLIRIEKISKHYNNSWSVWIVFKNSYDKTASTTCFIIGRVTFETTINEIDWLNTNHFDYRGLIEKGLAIEAPKGMY